MNFAAELLKSCITGIFLLVVISYYALLFIKTKKPPRERSFNSLSVIIPAHNEQACIAACIEAVKRAGFDGSKEIIVIDDGSTDGTAAILAGIDGIRLLNGKHTGKAVAVNRALRIAGGEAIAVLDADTEIDENALIKMVDDIERQGVAATTCAIKVKNRDKHILIYLHIEQIYNSLLRLLMSKVNANATITGQFGMFRKEALVAVGGFSSRGFSEDMDIGIRLIRAGYRLTFSDGAEASTTMPETAAGLMRQRTRYARGMLNFFMRHLRFEVRKPIDVYTMPLFVFTYVQAVIMGSFTIWQIISGYNLYFASRGEWFSLAVLTYFVDWFSLIGFIKWAAGLLTGATPATLINQIGILSTLLSYPLYFYAVAKFDRKPDAKILLAIFFIAPFWWLIMTVYIMCLPELLMRKQRNVWQKN